MIKIIYIKIAKTLKIYIKDPKKNYQIIVKSKMTNYKLYK